MGKELSKQTRQNWQINAFLFLSAIMASLSGVYFLYFPEGFMGGRNPLYNVTVIFNYIRKCPSSSVPTSRDSQLQRRTAMSPLMI